MRWRWLVPGVALIEVALALVTCAAGALVYDGFFATTGHLPALGLACLVGGVTAALGHRRAWSTALLAVAGLALVIVFGAFRGAGSAVLDGVRGSWNRLLTVAVPADPWGELLVVPVLVMWAAAFSAVLIVLRTRHALAPLVLPLAGFVFAVFVVGNQAGGHAIATVVFLVAALALIAIRAHLSTGSGTVRVERQSSRPIAALVLVALMVAASALFGVVVGQFSPLASGERRFDVRDVLAPPVANIDTLTPLAQVKRQLNQDPPRTLFSVRLEGEAAGQVDRLRTAVLDAFNGTTWTSTDTYRVAGSHLTVDPELVHSKPVTAHIELKEFAGPHLPVVGWPSRLGTPGEARGRFGFNPRSGVVVSTGSASGELSYDVTGEVGTRDEGLSRTGPTKDSSPPLPAGMPARLRALAEQFQSNPYDRLVALESYLNNAQYRPDRPPGHSYAAIDRLLNDGTESGGYAEQSASAFTVLARFWGFPARVAVGYRLDTTQRGTFHVTTANIHAWSEVHFAGYGWVVFDPSRPEGLQPNPPVEAPRVVPPRPAPPTPAPAASAPANAPSDAAQPTEVAGEQGLGWTKVLDGSAAMVLAAVLLVVLTAGSVVIVKALRRRRRRSAPGHAAQVLGAWREQLDRLTERGISPPVSLTFHEVAEHVRHRLGDTAEPVEVTADLATTAIYAPEHLDQAEADQAWDLVARLNTELYPRRMSAARLRAAADPRPLWTGQRVARRRRQAAEDLEMGRYR